jgi:hypothetical protein
MLKITIIEVATDSRWIVQGRLVGPWINELRTAWKRAHRSEDKRALFAGLATNVIVPVTRGQVRPAGLEMNGQLFEHEQRNGNTMQLEPMNAVGRANATSFSADRTAKKKDQ